MKATRTKRLCPTCGGPINRGPGQWAYCSDECRPTCIHPTCDKPTRGRDDVCASHRVQRRRHGELRPDHWAKEWVCVVCGKDVAKGSGRRKHCSANCQALDYNSRQRNGAPRPRYLKCAMCGRGFSLTVKSGQRIQRVDTKWCPDCGRDSSEVLRFRKYGVTPDAYAAAVVLGCDICGRTDKDLHVDHDHSCCPPVRGNGATCGECVRGFLCGNCNRALGLFQDDTARIERAINYLNRIK